MDTANEIMVYMIEKLIERVARLEQIVNEISEREKENQAKIPVKKSAKELRHERCVLMIEKQTIKDTAEAKKFGELLRKGIY